MGKNRQKMAKNRQKMGKNRRKMAKNRQTKNGQKSAKNGQKSAKKRAKNDHLGCNPDTCTNECHPAFAPSSAGTPCRVLLPLAWLTAQHLRLTAHGVHGARSPKGHPRRGWFSGGPFPDTVRRTNTAGPSTRLPAGRVTLQEEPQTKHGGQCPKYTWGTMENERHPSVPGRPGQCHDEPLARCHP